MTADHHGAARSVFPLDNAIQHYAWGSATRLPELLGQAPDGQPAAELWLGAHPSAPSHVQHADGTTTALDAMIVGDPQGTLGRHVSDEFGPRLPYLLKVLAADRALSLQVHPKPHLARAGFNRENQDGVPLDAPYRSFHDDQHKPEMLVAVSQFEALAGFRSSRNILALLTGLEGPLVAAVREELTRDRSARGIRAAFARLIAARSESGCPDLVAETIESVRARAAAGSSYERADATVLRLAQEHPGDPGAVASLLLNRVTLEPGEALFLAAGEIHAYLSGLGVEIMASSDNVLRAGLTTKHVDVAALFEAASFEPSPPLVPRQERSGARGQSITYRPPVREFALTVIDVDDAEPVPLPDSGPRTVICLEGDATLIAGDTGTALPQGRSAFITHAAGPVTLEGTALIACAWVP
ncbi:mannose-6-phosphate isomerase, class I [Xylanimonas cellulosilytica DSM 15894]|uniref:mannose-6-phosphate isomerase n=1 Tax=Xylanimonas cellulosilytica (strain DSM 15894 / JCM 12276 / CECT 5975 / KCTC 9989 / LMG 20990 / NBRC 107835 / XIL07) TaxID=446471 RepID=D1BWZ0_XYLCX|nr:mannose-6-phosphate isomerase, class I [Xylanimonas cellulosilytica]ACZ31558.1 mannose-6-phosphate isomerase, class I [Xylanimonas cellulosilytica DSM 15894]